MRVGKLNPVGTAKLNFPGFQEILDFTSAGSESSVSVTVDGDTDKEYKIVYRSAGSDQTVLRLNNDSTANIYGRQYILNDAGISAGRSTDSGFSMSWTTGLLTFSLLTPTSFIKTLFFDFNRWSSGTTISFFGLQGWSYNSTSNITSLNFLTTSGNFTSGTRITVYARRSNV